MDNLTESQAAEMEKLKSSIEKESQEREMSINSLTRERGIFTANLTKLTVQIDQVKHRIDDSDANISSELRII